MPLMNSDSFSVSTPDRGRIAQSCVCCGSKEIDKSPAVLMPFIADRVFGWKPVMIDQSWNLRTIPVGHAVSLCNSLLCKSCNLLFLDIRFTEDELALLYEDYRGESYVKLRSQYEPDYVERNNCLRSGITYLDDITSFLSPYLQIPVAVLDYGGDSGKNTPYREQSSVCHVYDISDVKPVSGVAKVSYEQAIRNSYDLIVCSNVLEHVPYPASILSDISRIMTDMSVLYLELPYERIMRESLDFADVLLKKRHWHEHINFFSLTSVQRLISRCGFEIVDYRELSVAKDVTLMQILCRLTPTAYAV